MRRDEGVNGSELIHKYHAADEWQMTEKDLVLISDVASWMWNAMPTYKPGPLSGRSSWPLCHNTQISVLNIFINFKGTKIYNRQ